MKPMEPGCGIHIRIVLSVLLVKPQGQDWISTQRAELSRSKIFTVWPLMESVRQSLIYSKLLFKKLWQHFGHHIISLVWRSSCVLGLKWEITSIKSSELLTHEIWGGEVRRQWFRLFASVREGELQLEMTLGEFPDWYNHQLKTTN